MSAVKSQLLNDRAVIRASGPDAEKFLQGLITNDMGLLAKQKSIFAGLLSPQGKLQFDFFVFEAAGDFWLDVAKPEAAELVERLARYRLRTNVSIEIPPGHVDIFAVWAAGAKGGLQEDGNDVWSPENAFGYEDPRQPQLGWRWMARVPDGQSHQQSVARFGADTAAGDYAARRIALGVPEGGNDYAFGELFPHEAMFDQLHGVSFTKGCYVGQEIVARMQHRGTARSRFLKVTAAGRLPPMGTPITAGAAQLGHIGSSIGTDGLALIRLDRLADAYAAKQPITAGGVELTTLAKPAYANFEVPAP